MMLPTRQTFLKIFICTWFIILCGNLHIHWPKLQLTWRKFSSSETWRCYLKISTKLLQVLKTFNDSNHCNEGHKRFYPFLGSLILGNLITIWLHRFFFMTNLKLCQGVYRSSSSEEDASDDANCLCVHETGKMSLKQTWKSPFKLYTCWQKGQEIWSSLSHRMVSILFTLYQHDYVTTYTFITTEVTDHYLIAL